MYPSIVIFFLRWLVMWKSHQVIFFISQFRSHNWPHTTTLIYWFSWSPDENDHMITQRSKSNFFYLDVMSMKVEELEFIHLEDIRTFFGDQFNENWTIKLYWNPPYAQWIPHLMHTNLLQNTWPSFDYISKWFFSFLSKFWYRWILISRMLTRSSRCILRL